IEVEVAGSRKMPEAPVICLPCAQNGGWYADHSRSLRFRYRRRDRRYDCTSDVVLNSKHIHYASVVSLGPHMIADPRINQLGVDPYTTTIAPYATLQDIAHAQLAGGGFHVHGTPFVGEAGMARYDEKRSIARQL